MYLRSGETYLLIYLSLVVFLFTDCDRDTCHGISRHAHFQSFGYALLTLFRVSTGDNWSGLLKVCRLFTFCVHYTLKQYH